MELKLACGCGQNYKFDVEPVNGQMPFVVNCPSCGIDGTATANATLAQIALPAPILAPEPGKLRINREATPPPAPATPPPLSTGIPAPLAAPAKATKTGESSFAMGIIGAVVGAAVGCGLMFGFYYWVHFRFPYMGLGIGALTGWGARMFYKGTDDGLAWVAASIALLAVVGTLYLMYGYFPFFFLISVGISGYIAYRVVAD